MFGLLLGGLKARFLFNRSCRKNLARIAKLAEPKFWQFFKPSFFFFLALMILTGVLSSRLAQGNYLLLCAVRFDDCGGLVGFQLYLLAAESFSVELFLK